MRILATFRHSEDTPSDKALADLAALMSNHYLIGIHDPFERHEIFNQMVEDMGKADRRRFESTWRELVRDPQSGTIASISVLPDRHLLVRLRNTSLQRLVPDGHALIDDIMRTRGPNGHNDPGDFALVRCEVRERGTSEGFLHGQWAGGEKSYLRFLFHQKRRAWVIVALFSIGLMGEVLLTLLGDQQNIWVQLGLRLGAPMLVSSLVLLLERFAQWRDQLSPQLVWSTQRDRENKVDPFRASRESG